MALETQSLREENSSESSTSWPKEEPEAVVGMSPVDCALSA